PEREQRDRQPDAAADAPDAVRRAEPERAERAVAPAVEDATERRAAARQATALQRRELVRGSRAERGDDEPAAAAHEDAVERQRGEAERRPDREVARDDEGGPRPRPRDGIVQAQERHG